MNWFDILVICILAAAVIAVAAVVIYNKAHGKGGDCDGCPGCHSCSSCKESGRCHYRIPEDVQKILDDANSKKENSGPAEDRHNSPQQ
ncbi:MAG: hypothetical protein LUD51_04790 [Clostridia bacterium]|nr:hypothetical protein [Clostridia bacterium]